MIVIGCDIGLSGALAAVDSRASCLIVDLPVVEDALGKRIDGRALIMQLRQFVPAGEAGLLVIENIRVRQMPGRVMSHANEGALMMARGTVQACADIARIEVRAVEPPVWKRHFGIKGGERGDAKTDARAIASRLYPNAAGLLKRVKDHNRAESVLIAHFGQAKYA